jgi:putative flippase GtrA
VLRKSRIARFVVVGVTNAAISFGLLNLCFYALGQSKIISSVIATAVALLFSFAMNRLFVFADKSRAVHQQFLPFAIVTISGSFLILNMVYIAGLRLLEGNEYIIINTVHAVTGILLAESFIDINVSTVLGAIAAMFWNYNGYRLFVFKGKKPEEHYVEANEAEEG